MRRLTLALLCATYLCLSLIVALTLWRNGGGWGAGVAALVGGLGLCFAFHGLIERALESGGLQGEIAAVRDACGPATLKVILEVSELETYDNIRAASFLAMRVLRPGDFIKTSTGKTSGNATLGNNQVMLEAIRDFYLDTGTAIAMKPAGGIRTAKQALQFLIAV